MSNLIPLRELANSIAEHQTRYERAKANFAIFQKGMTLLMDEKYFQGYTVTNKYCLSTVELQGRTYEVGFRRQAQRNLIAINRVYADPDTVDAKLAEYEFNGQGIFAAVKLDADEDEPHVEQPVNCCRMVLEPILEDIKQN